MRRDNAAGRPSGRVLAGRAALLAAGVGTVLGAGAGIASADEGVQMAPTGPSLDQASALQGLAPNLSLSDGATQAQGTPFEFGNLSGADLAALGQSSDRFSGLGSGQAGSETEDAGAAAEGVDGAGATDAVVPGAGAASGADEDGANSGAAAGDAVAGAAGSNAAPAGLTGLAG